MPDLQDIARALHEYRERYEYLDAFADDVEEIRAGTLGEVASLVRSGPRPAFVVPLNNELLSVELFPDQGIARFRLGRERTAGDRAAAGAIVGGLLGTLLGSASKAKEGLLGGLVLGMLVGGAIGQAPPVERVLALQFDPLTDQWRLYDGPLLRWAKRAIHPAA